MVDLPSGTVTFLFTDIEGSTRLLQRVGDTYATMLADHRRLLRAAVDAYGGVEVDTQGDSCFMAFARAQDGVAAAIAAQQALASQEWPHHGTVGIRMGLHTGEPTLTPTGYVGLDVHRAARLSAAGHGGQVLLSQTTRDLVGQGLPDGVTLRDLGEHRLKDLRLPERIYQLVVPDLPAEFPPLKSLDALPNNLPRQLTSFVGRERELAEVSQQLTNAALLTLAGAGGAGKTRLALQVAAELVDTFPDGVWLAELAPLTDPNLVAQAVASALGIPDDPRRSPTESLVEYLRTRDLLLVLDNCEHLVAACAMLADRVLRCCPTLKILATSREPLGIAGETIWRVPSLSLPAEGDRVPDGSVPRDGQSAVAEDCMRYEAIRLFVERAAAVRSGFSVTSQNAAAIVQICRRLDGIPLALELAAARVAALTVDQIASRLDDRFRLLTGGNRAALGRQQTLRALVDWSYDLLDEPERALLRRLAVFAGGWTLEAAEAVGAVGDDVDILDLLASLVNKSLVQVDEWHEAARYRLLETVRQYGLEKLREAAEEAVIRRRHRDWFLELGERATTEMQGPSQAGWLDRLETEHDNLRAALEWSAMTPGEAEAGLRLATTLATQFWKNRGHHREARARLADLLALAPGRSLTRAMALEQAAYLALRQGDHDTVRPLLEESLNLARELDAPEETARTLMTLGETLHGQGEVGPAREYLEEALALARAAGAWRRTAPALGYLGAIAYHLGDHPQATALYAEMLAISRDHGHRHGEAVALRGLGHLARAQADPERATALFRESLTYSLELKDRRCTPLCLEGLACVASAQGQAEQALRLFGASAAQRAGIGLTLLVEQADHDAAVAIARIKLDETTAAAAWAAGQTMSFDQAAEYALAAAATRPPDDPSLANRMGAPAIDTLPFGDGTTALTAREREVVSLIARGYANSEIAEKLVLSVRTVERHIANIYDKVGTHGKAARAAVTAFALTHRLVDPV